MNLNPVLKRALESAVFYEHTFKLRGKRLAKSEYIILAKHLEAHGCKWSKTSHAFEFAIGTCAVKQLSEILGLSTQGEWSPMATVTLTVTLPGEDPAEISEVMFSKAKNSEAFDYFIEILAKIKEGR